jgi:hypothetical protein
MSMSEHRTNPHSPIVADITIRICERSERQESRCGERSVGGRSRIMVALLQHSNSIGSSVRFILVQSLSSGGMGLKVL